MSDEPIVERFTVVIDTRKQAPFSFQKIRADSDQKFRPLVIPAIVQTLKTGDYSILGLEDWVTVERKSHDDLYGTLINGIERFEQELERMRKFAHAAIVVETDWLGILKAPEFSGVDPKSISRQIISLMLRFPTVHWVTCPDRRFAEVFTFQFLRKAHKHWRLEQRALRKTAQGNLLEAIH